MKPNQLPECHIDENDNHFVCYVLLYDDEQHQEIVHLYKSINGMEVEEVIKTCLICGEQDIYYPV